MSQKWSNHREMMSSKLTCFLRNDEIALTFTSLDQSFILCSRCLTHLVFQSRQDVAKQLVLWNEELP